MPFGSCMLPIYFADLRISKWLTVLNHIFACTFPPPPPCPSDSVYFIVRSDQSESKVVALLVVISKYNLASFHAWGPSWSFSLHPSLRNIFMTFYRDF